MKKPISYNGDEGFIFISYSHRNTDLVYDTLNDIQKDGFRFWFDDGIEPGVSWDDYIAEHIGNSGFFMAFISKEYSESENCIQELRFAIETKKPILLIRLDASKLSPGLEMRLCASQAINYYELDGAEYIEKIENAESISAFRAERENSVARYSYKEDYPILMRVLKQSYCCEAVFREHDLIDNILFWCLYNMGLIATPSSARIRDKIRPQLTELLHPGEENSGVKSLSVSTAESKLAIVSELYKLADTDFSLAEDDKAFTILNNQLFSIKREEYDVLLVNINQWCENVKEISSEMLKKSGTLTSAAMSTLAAQGQSYAKSLNEFYKDIRKGNKIRPSFGLK